MTQAVVQLPVTPTPKSPQQKLPSLPEEKKAWVTVARACADTFVRPQDHEKYSPAKLVKVICGYAEISTKGSLVASLLDTYCDDSKTQTENRISENFKALGLEKYFNLSCVYLACDDPNTFATLNAWRFDNFIESPIFHCIQGKKSHAYYVLTLPKTNVSSFLSHILRPSQMWNIDLNGNKLHSYVQHIHPTSSLFSSLEEEKLTLDCKSHLKTQWEHWNFTKRSPMLENYFLCSVEIAKACGTGFRGREDWRFGTFYRLSIVHIICEYANTPIKQPLLSSLFDAHFDAIVERKNTRGFYSQVEALIPETINATRDVFIGTYNSPLTYQKLYEQRSRNLIHAIPAENTRDSYHTLVWGNGDFHIYFKQLLRPIKLTDIAYNNNGLEYYLRNLQSYASHCARQFDALVKIPHLDLPLETVLKPFTHFNNDDKKEVTALVTNRIETLPKLALELARHNKYGFVEVTGTKSHTQYDKDFENYKRQRLYDRYKKDALSSIKKHDGLIHKAILKAIPLLNKMNVELLLEPIIKALKGYPALKKQHIIHAFLEHLKTNKTLSYHQINRALRFTQELLLSPTMTAVADEKIFSEPQEDDIFADALAPRTLTKNAIAKFLPSSSMLIELDKKDSDNVENELKKIADIVQDKTSTPFHLVIHFKGHLHVLSVTFIPKGKEIVIFVHDSLGYNAEFGSERTRLLTHFLNKVVHKIKTPIKVITLLTPRQYDEWSCPYYTLFDIENIQSNSEAFSRFVNSALTTPKKSEGSELMVHETTEMPQWMLTTWQSLHRLEKQNYVLPKKWLRVESKTSEDPKNVFMLLYALQKNQELIATLKFTGLPDHVDQAPGHHNDLLCCTSF